MANTDIKYRDFEGVTFNGRHSSEFHLVRVSDGDRYQLGLIPSSQHQTIDMPGKDGSYYYGKKDESRSFSLKFCFDGVTEVDIRMMRQWLSVDEPVPLIFDEWPYKVYYVMPQGEPIFENICFNEDGKRIYKGELEVEMVAYYPYARCQSKSASHYDSNVVAGTKEFEMGNNIVEGWYEDFDKYITRIDTEVFTRTEGLPYPTIEKEYIILVSLINGANQVSSFFCDTEYSNGKASIYSYNDSCYKKVADGTVDFNNKNKISFNIGEVHYELYPTGATVRVLSKQKITPQEGYTELFTQIGQYLTPQSKNFLFETDADDFPYTSYPPASDLVFYTNRILDTKYLGIEITSPTVLAQHGAYYSPALLILWFKDSLGSEFSINIGILDDKVEAYASIGMKAITDSKKYLISDNYSLYCTGNKKEITPLEKINLEMSGAPIKDIVSCKMIVYYEYTAGGTLNSTLAYDNKWSSTIEPSKTRTLTITGTGNTVFFEDEALFFLEIPPSLVPSITKINEWNLFNSHPDLGNEFSIKRDDGGEYQNYYDFSNVINKEGVPCFKLNSLCLTEIPSDQTKYGYKKVPGLGYLQIQIHGKQDSFSTALSETHKIETTPLGKLIIPALGLELSQLKSQDVYGTEAGFSFNSTGLIVRFTYVYNPVTETYESKGKELLNILRKNGPAFAYYYPAKTLEVAFDKNGLNYYYETINQKKEASAYGVKFPLWRKNNYISSEAPFSKIYIDARPKAKWENAKEWLDASGILYKMDSDKIQDIYNAEDSIYDKLQDKKIILYNPGDIPAPYKLAFNFNLAGKDSSSTTDLISLNNDYSLYWNLGGLDQTSIKLTADTRAALLNRVNFIDFNSLSPNYYLVDEYNRIQNLKYDGRWYSQMPLQKITFEEDTDLTLVLSLSDGLINESANMKLENKSLWTTARINFYRISDNIDYNKATHYLHISSKELISENKQLSLSGTVSKGNYLMSIQCFFKKSEKVPEGWGSNSEKNYTWKEQDIDKYYQLYLFENNKEPDENYLKGQLCFDSDKQSIYWTSDTKREVLLEDLIEEGKYLPIPVTKFFLAEQGNDDTIDMNFHFWKKNGTARTEVSNIGEIGLDTSNPVEIEYDYLYY